MTAPKLDALHIELIEALMGGYSQFLVTSNPASSYAFFWMQRVLRELGFIKYDGTSIDWDKLAALKAAVKERENGKD